MSTGEHNTQMCCHYTIWLRIGKCKVHTPSQPAVDQQH